MSYTFPLQQIAKTGDLNLNADFIMRQYKLDKVAKVKKIKSINSNLKQSETARELKMSSSTLQRYRREINMLSPYRTPLSSNTHTRKQKISNHTEPDLKVTFNDLKRIT